MKVLITGKNSKNIEGLVKNLGFEIVEENPDAIISFGGDGTLLYSEQKYPGVPKLPVRNSEFCKKCPEHEDGVILKALLENKLQLREYGKIEAQVSGKILTALNDFVIRNEKAIHAIRFQMTSPASHPEQHTLPSGVDSGSIFIGDGIVVSTSFGSSGYFKSVTGQTFNSGFGLAFNNTTEKTEPIFLNEGEVVEFKLIRGLAILTSDNNPDSLKIEEKSSVIFKLSSQKARIYEMESLRCPNCEVIRG